MTRPHYRKSIYILSLYPNRPCEYRVLFGPFCHVSLRASSVSSPSALGDQPSTIDDYDRACEYSSKGGLFGGLLQGLQSSYWNLFRWIKNGEKHVAPFLLLRCLSTGDPEIDLTP
ncbi:hypothetical protein HAX54_006027 [Datura stramonium]|uniref:Uncharacterized protein n=1 Tax=Datura stramonium TaxID=4076 RepID=A0ABS8RHV8_DATST|nr:hypothetical protein [Datura stramonium]